MWGHLRGNGRRRAWRWPIAVAALLAASAALPSGAGAQPSADQPNPFNDTPAAREAEALFQQLLKSPKNIDLTFRYAQAAIKAGNIEGGISSLERLLLLDKNFPGVRVQLAELYAKIHSFDMARTYLAEAREEPNLDEQMQARIQAVQREVDEVASNRNFTFNLLVGVRHQSDASAEPAGSDIVAGGVPQTLSALFIGRPGWDIFSTGYAQYVADLNGVKVETNALAYYSKALGHGVLDLGAIEINSGPRWDIDVGDTRIVSARPYAVVNEVLLGESQFLHGAGLGLSLDRAITKELAGSVFYEYRRDWFNSVALVPGADALNSDVHSLGLGLTYRVIEGGDLNFQTSYALTDAVAPGSNRGLVLHLSYSQLIQLPPEWGVGPLNLSPFVYRIYSNDHAPDPNAANPLLIPATTEWRYGATAKLGLTDNVALNFNAVRQVSLSNVLANRQRDTQLILGVMLAY
jgi:hypothetical protein